MEWILITAKWWLGLLILGIVFLPLTKKVFASFSFDLAYPIAKTLALIIISYSLLILGVIKILPFTQGTIFVVIGVFFLLNYGLIRPTNIK
jgi:hypothetical protein